MIGDRRCDAVPNSNVQTCPSQGSLRCIQVLFPPRLGFRRANVAWPVTTTWQYCLVLLYYRYCEGVLYLMGWILHPSAQPPRPYVDRLKGVFHITPQSTILLRRMYSSVPCLDHDLCRSPSWDPVDPHGHEHNAIRMKNASSIVRKCCGKPVYQTRWHRSSCMPTADFVFCVKVQ